MRIYPKKSLGQNFLVDNNIVRKIISALNLQPSDIILEIGSGRGGITALIAPKVKKVYAVELDKRLEPELSLRLKDYGNVEIINQDILKVDLKKLIKPKEKARVFGNIPYYISTPIIEYFIKHREIISDAFITVQKEFARRVVALHGSKEYGSLSIFVQYFTLPKIAFQISRGCFHPVPKVDSCLLSLSFRDNPPVCVSSEESFFRIVRAAFNQRRKALRNSLKGRIEAEKIKEFLLDRKKSPHARPEELSLEDFAGLTAFLP